MFPLKPQAGLSGLPLVLSQSRVCALYCPRFWRIFYLPRATIKVMSSYCFPALNFLASSTIEEISR